MPSNVSDRQMGVKHTSLTIHAVRQGVQPTQDVFQIHAGGSGSNFCDLLCVFHLKIITQSKTSVPKVIYKQLKIKLTEVDVCCELCFYNLNWSVSTKKYSTPFKI